MLAVYTSYHTTATSCHVPCGACLLKEAACTLQMIASCWNRALVPSLLQRMLMQTATDDPPLAEERSKQGCGGMCFKNFARTKVRRSVGLASLCFKITRFSMLVQFAWAAGSSAHGVGGPLYVKACFAAAIGTAATVTATATLLRPLIITV